MKVVAVDLGYLVFDVSLESTLAKKSGVTDSASSETPDRL
jgi:hypothetical protein